jgi:hypothetical protein
MEKAPHFWPLLSEVGIFDKARQRISAPNKRKIARVKMVNAAKSASQIALSSG